MTLPQVDVRSPKGPLSRQGAELVAWARLQLRIASDIVDNPGGGLLSATQTLGQVRVSLLRDDPDKHEGVAGALQRAEDAAIHRDFAGARAAIAEATALL